MTRLWEIYKQKAQDIKPFLKTKVGSRLAIIAIIDFVILFFAPLIHGFVGTAIFGCVGTVYLMLMWRKLDKEHVIVPAVILCIPMLLDMAIYHTIPVVVGFLITIIAMFLIALSPMFAFFDKAEDRMTTLLIAGALSVVVVVVACVTLLLVNYAWWILCIIAFFAVVAVFMGVVFSTAAYTASDGRRQARRKREREERSAEERMRDYRPRERDTTIYNVEDDDIRNDRDDNDTIDNDL
ncbi:hypothetical protein [uncultured Ruminococcus sp.]|uniref:hypothetical protein n=1 Tax=uncultured Ruminococcus sp. TaxID=165186 RepID=UPI00292E6D83|nr:hypothetical protein [uncultured Ruminococcus sp.]